MYIVHLWQILWNNSLCNKLFEIKPVIGRSQPVVRNVRQEEVVLARLILVIQGSLKREEHPYWFGCDAPFTVRHFLLECGEFSHIRNKYFHVDTIKQLFNDVPIDNVFLFVLESNLFNKLKLLSFYLDCLFFNLLTSYHFLLSRRRTCIVISLALCSCQILYMIFAVNIIQF